jgi:hypothetical protein
MVSKEQYYARKAAGLCTKCGKSREGSPSQARCLACHNKLKKKTEPVSEQVEVPVEAVAEKPTKTAQDKVKNLKNTNTVIDSTKNQKICQKCGDTLLSFNLICQKCIKLTVFTKYDAIARYGSLCNSCCHTQIDDLKIVSGRIDLPMKHKDQELFRLICYRRIPPDQYKVSCHDCYWKENLGYIKQMKNIFTTKGVFEESFISEDDILDV